MSDDNVVVFPNKPMTLNASAGHTILIIRPDGTKLRGGDMRPISELPAESLIRIIDELCDMFRGRHS